MEEEHINIRYLAQGMLKVPKTALPEKWDTMTPGQKLLWADAYMQKMSEVCDDKAIVDGIAYIGAEDCRAGLIEEPDPDGDWQDIVWRPEWYAWMEDTGNEYQFRDGDRIHQNNVEDEVDE